MHRREALGLIALAPWLPALQPPDATPRRSAHAIDALELFRLKVNHGEAPWRAELIDPPEAFDAGHVTPTDRPGFGIRLNDDLVRRLAP
jgi:L-alanine-DL-glutamate epimerase-like enolase superfamily enzyme